ncbi:MAG: hypothetical protein JJLCMIEE_02895 [Acidimicrobiales bacterium]|nr:MAG: gfo/Idh/MocA family oxidoreductase [Actinomycetota bacterium]MBV6509796.1 hypothetical protein [Acidimicrobiales bacterium]RIK04395.1 MAG: oxidoreductase [Acidobacteriota bacterium]
MKPVRFSVVGVEHLHAFLQAGLLVEAGAELVSYFSPEGDLLAGFSQMFPQARRVPDQREIMLDDTISLVVCAARPDLRAATAVEAMQHGKDVFVDKPGATTLGQLEELRRVQSITGCRWVVFFSERLTSPATIRAGELVGAGAIGEPVHTTGLGPHQLTSSPRPEWFFDPAHTGGILADLASHQVDQFLHFTGARDARVQAALVANWNRPDHRDFEDFGEVLLSSAGATGWAQVDWLSPDGLGTWGDVRLTILGTEGTIEIRKNIDLAGRSGGDHLLIVDDRTVRHVDCTGVELPFASSLLADVLDRTETAMTTDHAFRATELALQAQAQATRLGLLSGQS